MANEYGIGFWGQNAWNQNSDAYVSVTGNQLNTSINSVSISAEINSGWGRLTWGENDWGADGISQIISVSGLQLNFTLDSVNIDAITFAQISGNLLNSELGYLDPNPDVELIGNEINITTGDLSIAADSNLSVTGSLLSLSINSVVADANTIVEPTGFGISSFTGDVLVAANFIISVDGAVLNTELGYLDPSPDVELTGNEINVTTGTIACSAEATVFPSGIELNTSTGTLSFVSSGSVTLDGNGLSINLGNTYNVQIWTSVDTGTTVTYTEVSTGTVATWTTIDTAA